MNNTLSIIKNALNETNDYKLHFNSVQLTKANLQEINQVLQEKKEREWVLCSERLPVIKDGSLAYNELLLVTANIKDMVYTYLAYYSSCSGFMGLFGGDWNEHVLAWQPLPKPYRESEINV